MDEMKKYADLLSLLEDHRQSLTPDTSGRDEYADGEDDEILELASLLSKAKTEVIVKARLRICSAGLLAVQRHLASVQDSSW